MPNLPEEPKMPSKGGKELDVKAPSTSEKLQSLSNDVNAVSLPKIATTYNVGKGTDFSAKQNNLAKFATYGSEIYGKFGFDPQKNMNKIYDENTHWSVDIGRAYKGMKELAYIGVQDTFGLGAFADQGGYLDFENTMDKYSSSRGGVTGFVANTMTSAGYTVGIIGAIAAEEIALAGITALSGGSAAPATVAAGGTLLVRGIERLKNMGNLLKTVDKLQDVKTASTWLGRRGQGFTKGMGGFAKALNPLENTIDFVKNADKLADLNAWKQAAIGAGAVVRDARKITMSHSESKLEADLAEKEFRQREFDDFYADPANVGKPMPQSKLNQIDAEATKLKDHVYGANFGLIYATNAITFDNMFKNMRSANKFFSTAEGGMYRTIRDVATKQIKVEAMAKTFGNAIRKKASQITLKSSLQNAISSSMEGFQELGQDVISESFKSYHSRNVKGTQVRGGMLEYLNNDLKRAASRQWSEEGAITFLSGALMGVFASPAGFATGQVNKFLVGGGAQKTYQRVFDNKTWKAENASLEIKRKEKAAALTQFFNDNKNFIDGFSNPIYTQNELQEMILQAAENGDQKTFLDKQHEAFVAGVHNLLGSGLEKEFADHLEYMAKNFGSKELNEIFNRTDITDETKGKYQQKLREQASSIKNLRQLYDQIEDTVVNPHKMKGVKPSDPDFMEKFIKYRAFENLKKELLFSHAKIADKAKRIKTIQEELHKEHPLTTLEVNALIDTNALSDQIKLLELEVKANKEMNLTGEGLANAKRAEAKLAAYTEYKEKLNAFTSKQKKKDEVIYESDEFEDLFEAYNKVMATNDKEDVDQATRTERNKKTFDKVFDYINLGEENQFYQEFVDTLMNPTGASNFLAGQEDMLKRLEANKEEHITNALKAFEEKATADGMLNALQEEGLFFDLSELDDLIKNRIMPSEIFDINNNNKEATPEQVQAAQDIIASFIKKLTGKSIVNDKTQLNKQGRRLKSDKRTVAGIIRQYNLKLNKQVTLSSKEGQRLLQKLMDKENKYFTKLDREILEKLGEQDVTIKIVNNNSLPVQITEDGVIELDIRFAGRDYKNSPMSFENLLVTGLTQKAITEKLKENDDLWLATRNVMEQAKAAFKQMYPGATTEDLSVFESPELFLTEAMNDLMFQKILSSVVDTEQPASKSLWGTLSEGIKEIVEEDFEKKLVTRVINIAAKALDSSIVENISDVNEPEVAQEEKQKEKEKFDELTTMAKDLGQKWNVNVKVIASQEEAEKILDSIENPFFQNEEDTTAGFYDEKTNTAYIVADAVKPNTMYHEIFLHPYLIKIEKTNPALYKSLVAEAKANKEAVEYVEKNYGTADKIGVRQYEHELVGRVYNMSVNNELDKIKDAGLISKLGQFIKNMFANIGQYFGIKKTDITRLNEKKATIADLAKYSVKENSSADLASVVEAATPPVTQQKPKGTKKVTRQRTVTKMQKVNKGGELLILENASDQPGLFEDFLAPHIYFSDTRAVTESTNQIVSLGEELDAKNIIESGDWKFGDLRVEVDGRLVIDVIANVPIFDSSKQTLNQKFTDLQNELILLNAQIAQEKANTQTGPTEQNFEVHVGGIERGYTESKESKDKGVGDIRGLINQQSLPQGVLITNGATNSATQNDRFVVVYSKVDANGNNLFETVSSGQPREGWVTTSVKISENATQEEIDLATKAARIKMNAILPNITGGNFVLSKVDASTTVPVKITPNSTTQNNYSAAIKEYEAAIKVFTFSQKKFPGKNMPLYQYLRMLNKPKPVVGEFAYYINRNNTSDPTVDKLGTVTSVDAANNSFTYVDANGKSFTKTIDEKTIEHGNPYFLFSASEVKNELSYDEVEDQINANFKNNAGSTTTGNIDELEKQKQLLESKLKSTPEYIFTKTNTLQQVGTKKVRFLMYKSTGTGSTEASKGEWVPLIHIGKKIDPKSREVHEWFVKQLFEGQDPKLNKYNSNSFRELDRILKDQEDVLFDKPENWVEEQIDEVITEEIEVPVEEDDTEVTPESEKLSEKTPDEIVKTAEKIQSEIKQIESKLEKLNAELASSLPFAQKRTVRRQILELSIELNDLFVQLNDIQPALNSIDNEKTAAVEEELEYVPKYDYNNNEIITHQTPWMSVPEELRTQLSSIYGKALNKLNQDDVLKIKEEIKSNPLYIGAISDFTNKRLQEQDTEKGKAEAEENQRRIDAAKAARQEQLAEEQQATRAQKRAMRLAKQPPSDEQMMKNLLKGYDYSILTPKEISMLMAQFKNKDGLLEFTVNDIISYISNKKAEKAKKELKKKIQDDIEFARKEAILKKERDARIQDNFDTLNSGRLYYYDDLKRSITKNIPKEMVKFIATYYPELFTLPSREFKQEVGWILDQRKHDLKIAKPITFKPNAIHLQVRTLVKTLEKAKKLYPETVYKINLALSEAGSDIRIKKIRPSKNASLSTMYYIGKKTKGEKRTSFYSGKYEAARTIVKQTPLEYSREVNAELAIVQYLISGGKVRPSSVRDVLKAGGDTRGWRSITSNQADSKTESFDGAANYILEGAGFDMSYGGEYEDFKDAFELFLSSYSGLNDAISKIAERLKTEKKVSENQNQRSESDEELNDLNEVSKLEEKGFTKEEAFREIEILKFLATDEGKQILDDEAKALSEFYDSAQAEIIDGYFSGDEENLSDEDFELLNVFEFPKDIAQQIKDVEEEQDPNDAPAPESETEVPKEKEEEIETTGIDKAISRLQELNNTNIPFDQLTEKIFDALNNEMRGNLTNAIASYKFFMDPSVNAGPKRKNAIVVILNAQFRTGVFNDAIVNIDNKAYRVVEYDTTIQEIKLQDLKNIDEFTTVSLGAFMNKVIDELQPGQEFNNMKIDTVVKVNEIDYIKEAYNEIFNNFTSFMGEAVALSDEALLRDLKTETTKCK